jgi:hypothetical protein
LRNLANALACGGALDAEIIAHWDSDDWSSPERLTEQVELLQSSGARVVGYSEALFWDTSIKTLHVDGARQCEAWLFSSPNPKYMIGTSLMYNRSVWEKTPFDNLDAAEDLIWQNKIKAKDKASVSSLRPEPRLIASIHGGNTTAKITPGAREWVRSPEYDAICRERMKL